MLQPSERRRLLLFIPLVLFAAGVEVLGVAAVIPFLAVLADPASVRELPVVGPAIAAVGIDDDGQLVRWMGFLLVGTILVANTVMIVKQYWVMRFTWGLNTSLSARLLRHYLAQPYVFTLSQNTSALVNKLVEEVRKIVDTGFRMALEVVVRIVITTSILAFLVALDPVLATAVFGAIGAAYAAVFGLSRSALRRFGREAIAASAARVKAVNEAMGGFKDLKVTGRELYAHGRFEAPTRRYGILQSYIGAISTLPRYAFEAIAVGGMVLIATLLAGRDGDFAATVPILGAYAVAGLRLLPSIQSLFSAFARMRAVSASLDLVAADFREAIADDLSLQPAPTAMPLEHSIDLDDVWYRYPGTSRPVLEAVTMSIKRGSSIAFVGRTGSGKTTLVDVVLGLLEPERGVVSVDGVAITPEQRRPYRRLFGYVPQSIFLVDDTITRNVAFGVPDAELDLEAVRRACRAAQILEFIERELPDGFDTVVGERGVRLSGGQRQRIGIARALYHQPRVLVFDEATSALDVHTEQLVYEAFEQLAREHTIIMVAHRLVTAEHADHVFVLDHGRIIDEGPPSEVLARYQDGALVS